MGTTNICERLVRHRHREQAKCADRLEPKRCAAGRGLVVWLLMDTMPPVYRTGPTHLEIRVELGKPIVLPVTAGEP
jgi:hypothetical protein